MTPAHEPITRDESYELERWLGLDRFKRVGLDSPYGQPVTWSAPKWLLLLAAHRKEVFQVAVERYTQRERPLMAASTAVTRAQLAVLDLVDRAHESGAFAGYIEGLLRLVGGRAIFPLIDERCRLDADLILRAERGKNDWRPPA